MTIADGLWLFPVTILLGVLQTFLRAIEPEEGRGRRVVSGLQWGVVGAQMCAAFVFTARAGWTWPDWATFVLIGAGIFATAWAQTDAPAVQRRRMLLSAGFWVAAAAMASQSRFCHGVPWALLGIAGMMAAAGVLMGRARASAL